MGVGTIEKRFAVLSGVLNERTRRLFAAAEAHAIGHGGIAAVIRATGVSRSTVERGIREIEVAESLAGDRIRRPGGGRKKLAAKDPTLLSDLEALVEPTTRGDPESPLRWTCKSVRALARQLQSMGHLVSYPHVAQMLKKAGYSLQANKKTREGASHPDRNAQFEHINRCVRQQQMSGQPVISVDTKKKELVGDFKNGGREWRPKGMPEPVRVHDFLIPQKGKAIPHGVYDLTRNAGWVSIGIDHDTATFAVNSIRDWWRKMGKASYPRSKSLMITADAGGSNSSRSRLWKWELQKFSNETGMAISVCHFPPGTSKWNKIEHRLFSYITRNWRAQPLETLAVIVSLIAGTTTQSGLLVRCQVDTRRYPKGKQVSNADMASINIRPDEFHGDWNYRISPQ